ncbi:outer membrane protein assembly factor BamB family protein [Saccharothrix obliqua]|uniref:outer membrane protein assembly factor BamB family protein n=1 Tax=Saccharothrix obliqua TaxID=2861747 RepID=UPI001C5FEFE4|nr:PQQ-binding-like beta-propeller repeat protein [Saccharothrix obliqua]MBW4721415.1 hypothetical protein [Saccharothrix obliqua]
MPAVHRTVVVVDVEGFGDPGRTTADQVAVRDALYGLLRGAVERAGVRWEDCHHEDRGDGVVVLAPADTAKSVFVDVVPDALATALREHNATHGSAQRIRLRMAVHAGEVAYDRHGVTAPAVTFTFRLVDAEPLKAAHRASPGSLALVVSPWFFDEVVRHSRVVDPATFRPVEIAVKETTTRAWIALPDHPYPADPTRLAAATPPADARPTGVHVGSGVTMRGSVIAGRDVDQSRRTRIGIGGLVLALVLVGGYAVHRADRDVVGVPRPGTSASGPAATTRPAASPATRAPTRFEPGPRVSGVVAATITLEGDRLLHVTDSRLVALDLRTGREVASVARSGPPPRDVSPAGAQAPPAVVRAGGRTIAVAAFPTLVAGSGTTPDGLSAELVAMDLSTGEEAWTGRVATPRAPTSYPWVYVAGASDRTVVVVAGGEQSTPTSIGVDLASRKEVWRVDGFETVFVDGSAAVGRAQTGGYWDARGMDAEARALDAATGTQLWVGPRTGQALRLTPFGPGRVWVHTSVAGLYRHDTVHDTATGAPQDVAGFEERPDGEPRACAHDRQRLTVCQFATTRGGMLAAYDGNANRLWTLGGPGDASGRLVPSLGTAWHGAVYGALDRRGPVVLDAVTGADRDTAPGATPTMVNEHGAVVVEADSRGFAVVDFLTAER